MSLQNTRNSDFEKYQVNSLQYLYPEKDVLHASKFLAFKQDPKLCSNFWQV